MTQNRKIPGLIITFCGKMSVAPKAVHNKMRNKFTEESFRLLDPMPLKLRTFIMLYLL